MTNEKLQSVLKNYPDECEIIILDNSYKSPVLITVEHYEDNDFKPSRIIIEVENC